MAELLSLFPPGSAVDADGTLVVGGCRADDLAAEFGTPVLVVAEQALREKAREYADGLAARWPKSRVVFASKAFPCTAVQRVMVQEGLGLDVAGGGEIITALAAGADPALLVLHGNAKTDEEIALAVEHGLGLVVVDNADDVDRLEAFVPPGRAQDVLVRVTPGITADTHAHVLTGHEGSKFGLSPALAADLIRRIEHSPRLRLRGLHVHIGSQILDVDPFAASVAAAGGARGVRGLRPRRRARGALHLHRPTARRRGLSGRPGRGRSRAPARRRAAAHRAGPEHGRHRRHDAVPRRHRQAGRASRSSRWTAAWATTSRWRCSGSASRPPSPPGWDWRELSDGETVTVVGRHCESGDVLVDGVRLPDPRVGDLLAVPVTGAYCFTMSNNYNGNRRIPVVFVRDGDARLVVRRESWTDLLSRDVE